jgi:hypothetical protein
MKPARHPKPKLNYPGDRYIQRSILGARKAGLDVGSVEIAPDGTIRIIDKSISHRDNLDEFEQWEAAGKLG